MTRDQGTMPVDQLPGAGPAAALVASTAASLVATVALLSRESWEGAGAATAQAQELRRRALGLAEADAVALAEFHAARDSDETRPAARDFQLGRAFERAAEVPLAIAETACDIALLAAEAARHCGGDVRADAAGAALLAQAATRTAAHLVEVNLVTAGDDELVVRVRKLVVAASGAADEATASA